MADHTVDTAFHGTLSATTVDAVTLTREHPNAEVKNRGDVAIYATINGSTPTVGGADTFVVPAGESVVLVLSTRPGVPDVVKLIASDSCAYSVTGVSRDFERSGGGSAASGGGGGGGAVTVADGADVALGATTDAAATGNGSVVGILKRLRTLLNGGLPAALGAGGGVKIDGSGTAVPVSGTVTASDGGGSLTVDGTVTANAGTGPFPVSDNGGSLTVDGTVAVTDGGGSLTVDGTVTVTGVATEATLDSRTGALTETAPTTDTASSGINGRLQRIAQRLTSTIALLGGGLPAALAAGGGLKVEGVSGGVSQPVDPRGSTALIQTSSAGLTVAATPYTAGDQLGTEMSFANVVRAAGGTGRIDHALLMDKAKVVAGVDLYLFDRSVTPAADNASFAFSDTDMMFCQGVVEFRAAKTGANNAVLLGLGLPIVIKPNATTLFGHMVTQSGHAVFAAVGDLVVTLGIAQD